jgi:hypothetical protein
MEEHEDDDEPLLEAGPHVLWHWHSPPQAAGLGLCLGNSSSSCLRVAAAAPGFLLGS